MLDEVQSHVDCISHRPVGLVDKLQGVQRGPGMSFRGFSTILEGFHDDKQQGNGPVVIQSCDGGALEAGRNLRAPEIC